MRIFDDTGEKIRYSLLLLVVATGVAMAYPVADAEYPSAQNTDDHYLTKWADIILFYGVTADDVEDTIASYKESELAPSTRRNLEIIQQKLKDAESGKHAPDVINLADEDQPEVVHIHRDRREAKDDSSSSDESSSSSQATNNEDNNITM